MLRFALFALFASAAVAQQIKQCTCADIQQCEAKYVDTVIPCADACKQHAAQLGANYDVLKKCIIDKEPMIISTMSCTEKTLHNSCAAAPGKMVPKRYPETLKIAALAEINRMLSRSGIDGQVKGMLATGKKFAGCVKSCMDKKSNNCIKKLGCGLDLPSDNELVQIAKRCAINAGFNTAAVRNVCNCASGAGIRGLQGVCDKIVIA